MTSKPIESRIRDVLENFLEEMSESSRLSPQELERVLAGEKDDLQSSDLGQKPETFTENKLIFPLLDAVNLKYEQQPHGQSGARSRWPDFGITNLNEYVVGESKPLNNVDEAEDQVAEYLDSISIGADYGIATDGIQWFVYTVERSGDVTEFPRVKSINLQQLLFKIARENKFVNSGSLTGTDTDSTEIIQEFIEIFEQEHFNSIISVEAPQIIRNRRKRDIEEFYDLYIELLFGEGEDYSYDTHLMADIVSPPEATEQEERQFAVTLMNRLLFIKILEGKGVVDEGLLGTRLETYEENSDAIMQGFYEAQLQPLFYGLFNTRKKNRKPKYKTGWTDEIPYLNGGLFRENIPNEKQYSVRDRILTDIIENLIEGSVVGENDNRLDPAILGSVFEMTINYMGGEFGSQKDIGAYYTPDDVTQVITERTVDPRAKDLLVNTWTEAADENQSEIKTHLEDHSLPEFLEKVEDGSESVLVLDGEQTRIDFGDKELIRSAIERLSELTVLDPACGSGHFLTTVMDQIHRVRKSLERGLNGGEGLTDIEDYKEKKSLALNNIYGVDVDPVGVEIARLRIWLKIIEEGWEEDYGRLPNIELNIISGNSLVGLPVEQKDQLSITTWDDRLEELIGLRQEYKAHDDISRQEVLDKRDDIRESFNEVFLERLTYTYTTEVTSIDGWTSVVNSITGSSLHPEIESIQVKRADRKRLSDADKERLQDAGFNPFSKSARLDIEQRQNELTPEKSTLSNEQVKSIINDELSNIIKDNYEFTEVVRQPLAADLDNILGSPLHWVAEFPEVAAKDSLGKHTVSFDIIIGNPPYGNLLSESEKVLTEWYATSEINEISAQFIERQLQTLAEGGYYGNITSLRFVYQNDAYPVHDYMREAMEDIQIACFSHRPQPIFANATVRSAIVSGRKNTEGQSGIRTSELIMLDEETREQKLSNIQQESVEGLLLRDTLGAEERDGYEILPKVGPHRHLLEKLKSKSDRVLGELRDKSYNYPNFRKRGGGYWLGYGPENEWGDLTSIDPLYYETELQRDAAFLLVNSSLFYVYWLTYSNFRNFDFGHIDKFPFPFEDTEELEEYEEEITEYKEKLWQAHLDSPGKKSDERFEMSGVKPIIDEIEENLISEWFDLSEEQVDYLTKYHAEHSRHGPENNEITEY